MEGHNISVEVLLPVRIPRWRRGHRQAAIEADVATGTRPTYAWDRYAILRIDLTSGFAHVYAARVPEGMVESITA